MKTALSCAVTLAALGGCTSTNLQNALGTPKNPTAIYLKPNPAKGETADQSGIIVPLYKVLLEASTADGTLRSGDVDSDTMRRYLGAGFALSDIYCSRYFVKTDESYRRRRFGRTVTNDVGTAMATILGLAKAGTNVVTGVAAAVGLADSSWRNYDDSFLISPDLSNVQGLVFAAQDNFRARTLSNDETLPSDYGTAQSVILRYANLCSYLGMKSLLDRAAGEQRTQLDNDTTKKNGGADSTTTTTTTGTTDAQPAAEPRPAAAPLAIAPNK